MDIVDQSLSVKRLEERLARTTDDRQRQMLSVVLEHLAAEADISLERLLATLAPTPAYHLWANGADYGPKGRDGVAEFYTQLVRDKRGVLEFDITRIVVDDATVVTEGWIRAINQGRLAKTRGYDVDDDDAHYLVTSRVVIFWPFNEAGEMLGEDGYSNWDAKVGWRKLSEDELPEVYKALFAPA
jgi:hypothetical protein